MKKLYILILLVLLNPKFGFSIVTNYQDVVEPGDLAFISYNTNGATNFSFIVTNRIAFGQVIYFTDNGWLASGGFRNGEGVQSWTSPGVSCGEIITIESTLSLSTDGDQILAYQGDVNNPTFIAAINFEGSGWQTDAIDEFSSALPLGLTDGENAVAINEINNAKYSGSNNSFPYYLTALTELNNPANWSGDDNNIQSNPDITIDTCFFEGGDIYFFPKECDESTVYTDTYSIEFIIDMGRDAQPRPFTVDNGTISTNFVTESTIVTITGATEGLPIILISETSNSNLQITIHSPICNPDLTTCYDLSQGSESFEIVSVISNSTTSGGQWINTAGEFQIDGNCSAGCNEPVESWLVFGPLDLSNTNAGYLYFDSEEIEGNTDLEILSTSNYSTCPSNSTWTNLQTITDQGSYYIDLTSLSGTNDFIAIKYVDDGADGYSDWVLRNAKLVVETIDVCPTLGTRPNSNCENDLVRINEIDSDTPGIDTSEFVELRGPANQSLDGYVLVFYDGSNLEVIETIDLANQICPDDGDGYGYFVIGGSSISDAEMTMTDGFIIDGANAICLYYGRTASEFSVGSGIGDVNYLNGLIDGIHYGTGQTSIPELVPLLIDRDFEDQNGVFSTVDIVNEDIYSDKENQSIQRGSWFVAPPTIGEVNANPVITPIRFGNISAEYVNKIAQIKWNTMSESESSHFIIEHSSDGQSWVELGQIPAAGNSSMIINYEFVHNNPLFGENYYRVKQVDFDDQFSYSNVVLITSDNESNFEILAFDRQKIYIESSKMGLGQLSLFNAQGKLVEELSINLVVGTQVLNLEHQGLGSGIYFIQLISEDNLSMKKFFIP